MSFIKCKLLKLSEWDSYGYDDTPVQQTIVSGITEWEEVTPDEYATIRTYVDQYNQRNWKKKGQTRFLLVLQEETLDLAVMSKQIQEWIEEDKKKEESRKRAAKKRSETARKKREEKELAQFERLEAKIKARKKR